MIKFALKCAEGHSFDSWFGSSGDYDTLRAAGRLECVVCGSSKVEKSLMAPRVTTKDVPEPGPLSAPASAAEQAIRALREKVEAEAQDVGTNFAKEARDMHNGHKPERAIYRQAKPAEAKALHKEGIPVMPLPWGRRQTN